jgi:acyl-CoA thioesterase-1
MLKRFLTVLVFVHCAAATAADSTVVVVGDSLSSGYGLGTDNSWVALLEERLGEQAYGYAVVNASIAGDTTAGGLARLPQLLAEHQPAIVIIELGGNDGLRGQAVSRMRENLASMIELILRTGAQAVLAGIQIPPNYGPAYTEQFAATYPALAARYQIPLIEFLMDGIALHPSLMQPDRIHPNADGQQPMLDNVWHVLEGLL